MAQLLDIQPLRRQGERVTTLTKAYVGLFRVTQNNGQHSLSLVSPTGELLLGPLLDPEFVMADADGLVLGGREPGTGLSQEWQILAARKLEGHPEYPVW
jgi:hypothetical protein